MAHEIVAYPIMTLQGGHRIEMVAEAGAYDVMARRDGQGTTEKREYAVGDIVLINGDGRILVEPIGLAEVNQMALDVLEGRARRHTPTQIILTLASMILALAYTPAPLMGPTPPPPPETDQ